MLEEESDAIPENAIRIAFELGTRWVSLGQRLREEARDSVYEPCKPENNVLPIIIIKANQSKEVSGFA